MGSMMTLKVADEFTKAPGARLRVHGTHSGQEFREDFLEPAYKQAELAGVDLLVDLDGCFGYTKSFLEEAFGGLARAYGADKVLARLRLKCDDELGLIDDVRRYISNTRCG